MVHQTNEPVAEWIYAVDCNSSYVGSIPARFSNFMTNKAHSFNLRFLHWSDCSRCDYMLLKNDASRKMATKPCLGDFDEKKESLQNVKWVKK